MKESKGKKWLWTVLGVVLLLLVGIIGYLSGQLSSIKKDTEKAHNTVESSKAIKSSNSSMVSSVSFSEKEQDLDNSSSIDSQNSASDNIHSGDSGNGLIDTRTNTFAGKYHNVHDLANDGYTVITWLEKNEGMTHDAACAFVNTYYPFFYKGFLTSGDVQDVNMYRNSLDSSDDNDTDDEDNNETNTNNNDVDTNNTDEDY